MSRFLGLRREALGGLIIFLLATVTINFAIHELYMKSMRAHPDTEHLQTVVGIAQATISDRPITSSGLVGCLALIIDYGDQAFFGHVRQGKLYGEDALAYASRMLGAEGRNLSDCRFAVLYTPEADDQICKRIAGDLRAIGVEKVFEVPYRVDAKKEQRDIIYDPAKDNLLEIEVKASRNYNFAGTRPGDKHHIIVQEILSAPSTAD